MENQYMQHLLFSMKKRMETVRNQLGKTDIEPEEYYEKVEKWHQDLIELITKRVPESYVSSVVIYERDMFDIEKIEYVYFENNERTGLTSISILDNMDI